MKNSARINTFGKKVIDFYENFSVSSDFFPANINAINPFMATPKTQEYAKIFYNKFFSDTKRRVFIFGINPGRLGGGMTGIPFTDPVMLEEKCGISNEFLKKRELSSNFIYQVINEWGGVQKFYESFFLTAIFPFCLTYNGLNYNYYDDLKIFLKIRPLIVESLKRQIEFGAYPSTGIILGTGKNLKIFKDINNEFRFFKDVYALEHPRFIMQYRRKDLEKYIKKYQEVLSQSIS